MMWIRYVAVGLIVLGALFIARSLILFKPIFQLKVQSVKKENQGNKRLVQLYGILLFVFLFGYTATVASMMLHINLTGEFIVGLIFCFGGVFVLISVHMQTRMLADIKNSYDQIVHDMDERNRVEKALRESEKKYRILFEKSADAILIIDAEGERAGKIVDANQAAAAMHGYTREELLELSITELDTPECAADVPARIEQMRSGQWIKTELIHIKKDGSVFPVEVVAGIVEIGGHPFIFGFDRDITENKKHEAAVREQLILLQTLIETIPSPIFYKDTGGRYLGCNTAFEKFIGKKKASICGKTDYEIAPEALAEIHHRSDRELLAKGGTQIIEADVKRADGSPRHVMMHKATFPTPDASIGGLVGAFVDITDLKTIKKQVLRMQKMEAIGTLAGGIAHDFNNILSGIFGYTEMAMQELPPHSRTYDTLGKVLGAAERAKALVKQILTFSRQEERMLKPVRVDLIAGEVIKLIRASLPATIEIQQDFRSAQTVMADPTQLHQILMNLCTNAAHAMRSKGGVLALCLDSEYLGSDIVRENPRISAGNFLRMTVKDTGCGIPREHMDRLFDPFFTTKGMEDGTGLGLSVVHGIVESSGGMIQVDSVLGEGSEFSIYLPAIEGDEYPQDPIAAPLLNGTERILFVDDEEFQADIAKQMLERLGYRVTTYSSSQAALEAFVKDPQGFDLVLTDMTMPQMTGDELGRRILALRPEMPVIICTGYSEKISEKEAMEMGIRAYVMKPLTISDLSQTIRSVLD